MIMRKRSAQSSRRAGFAGQGQWRRSRVDYLDFGPEIWKATMSPTWVLVEAMVPTGSSSVFVPRQDQAMPHGFTFRFNPTTRFLPSRKMTSIGNRMNHM